MHYLPQCYLKGFAMAPSKKSQLHVFDMKTNRWFQTVARNVGARRDFNTVKLQNQPPDAVESLISGFETKFDAILTTMRQTFCMPTGADFENLMAMVAMMAIRNPLVRQNHNKFQTQVLRRIMDLEFASKERYEATVQRMKEDGISFSGPDIAFEDLKKFHQDGEYSITIENTINVISEMKTVPTVAALLTKRKWTLIITGKTAGHFICCDHPVSLTWNDGKLQGGFHPPGYALPSTDVVFPVTKEMALIGTFEGEDRVITANADSVALLNSRIIENCDWQIYSPRAEFTFLTADRNICHSEQLKDFLKRSPES